MAQGGALGIQITDVSLADKIRALADEYNVSYRAIGEALLSEAVLNPNVLETASRKAIDLNRYGSYITRLVDENLALKQRIAELESLHPNSLNIQAPLSSRQYGKIL